MFGMHDGKAKYLVMVSFPGCLPDDSAECETLEEALEVAKEIISDFRDHDAMLKANGMSDGESVAIVTPLREIRAYKLPVTYAYCFNQYIEIAKLEE